MHVYSKVTSQFQIQKKQVSRHSERDGFCSISYTLFREKEIPHSETQECPDIAAARNVVCSQEPFSWNPGNTWHIVSQTHNSNGSKDFRGTSAAERKNRL
ncbi:unnamed protein product [Dicrocoelium dendriticum]|nr:unnamed protein product [Dicrocoelium dendriticum]